MMDELLDGDLRFCYISSRNRITLDYLKTIGYKDLDFNITYDYVFIDYDPIYKNEIIRIMDKYPDRSIVLFHNQIKCRVLESCNRIYQYKTDEEKREFINTIYRLAVEPGLVGMDLYDIVLCFKNTKYLYYQKYDVSIDEIKKEIVPLKASSILVGIVGNHNLRLKSIDEVIFNLTKRDKQMNIVYGTILDESLKNDELKVCIFLGF